MATPTPPIDPNAPPTPWDTQKFRQKFQEMAAMVLKDDDVQDEVQLTKSYLLVIVASLIVGVLAVVLLTWLRPDFDFVVVSISVFAIVSMVITNIFQIMKQQQTLIEARAANLKAQLALEQTKATGQQIDGKLGQWKEDFFARAFMEGEKAGRVSANDRTDALQKLRQ